MTRHFKACGSQRFDDERHVPRYHAERSILVPCLVGTCEANARLPQKLIPKRLGFERRKLRADARSSTSSAADTSGWLTFARFTVGGQYPPPGRIGCGVHVNDACDVATSDGRGSHANVNQVFRKLAHGALRVRSWCEHDESIGARDPGLARRAPRSDCGVQTLLRTMKVFMPSSRSKVVL
jgi:hypothetical protein